MYYIQIFTHKLLEVSMHGTGNGVKVKMPFLTAIINDVPINMAYVNLLSKVADLGPELSQLCLRICVQTIK